MIQVRLELDDTQRIEEKAQRLSTALRDMAIYLKSQVQETFVRGQGRKTPWPDLSPRTKKYKIKKKGTAYPMLVFTGRLRNSINISVGEKEAKVYSGVKYGVFHQTGTRHMPARPFLEVTDSDVPVFVSILRRHLFGR